MSSNLTAPAKLRDINMWQNMTTAPKDGTVITMIGHIDIQTKKKNTYRGYFKNGDFITVTGWILFPDKWKP